MRDQKKAIDSMCESYLRNLGEVLQENHHGVWDEDFERNFLDTRALVINDLEVASKNSRLNVREEVVSRFRAWRKANKKVLGK